MTTFVGTSLLAQAYVQEMEYSDAQRSWQDRFDTRRIADRINQVLVHDHIDDGSRAFIESLDMMFVSTVDATGQPTCSYKGGDPERTGDELRAYLRRWVAPALRD